MFCEIYQKPQKHKVNDVFIGSENQVFFEHSQKSQKHELNHVFISFKITFDLKDLKKWKMIENSKEMRLLFENFFSIEIVFALEKIFSLK